MTFEDNVQALCRKYNLPVGPKDNVQGNITYFVSKHLSHRVSNEKMIKLIGLVFDNVDHEKLRDTAWELRQKWGPDAVTEDVFDEWCRIDSGVACTIICRFNAEEQHIEFFCKKLPDFLWNTYGQRPHPNMRNMRASIVRCLRSMDDAEPLQAGADWCTDTLWMFSNERKLSNDVSISSTTFITPPSINHDITSTSKLLYSDVVVPSSSKKHGDVAVTKPFPRRDEIVMTAPQLIKTLLTSFLTVVGMDHCKFEKTLDGQAHLDIVYHVQRRFAESADRQASIDPLMPQTFGFVIVAFNTESDALLRVRFKHAHWDHGLSV